MSCRFFALWLALALSVPNPALALRAVGLEESNQQPVLDDTLRGSSPRTREAGMEEDPIAAALQQGSVSIMVDAGGIARINGQGAAITIPSELRQSRFFVRDYRVLMVPWDETLAAPGGVITFVDQVGLSQQPAWTRAYYDMRHVTDPSTFQHVVQQRGLPNKGVVILHGLVIASTQDVHRWMPDATVIGIHPTLCLSNGMERVEQNLPHLIAAAAAHGGALAVLDVSPTPVKYRDRKILLIQTYA
ncbi:MAG: hypothetical protein HY600_03760 [Candidatus Omnitrophica bacterium]|nr:hypothetical protein [Candidatus Omnitrophota bacterium]